MSSAARHALWRAGLVSLAVLMPAAGGAQPTGPAASDTTAVETPASRAESLRQQREAKARQLTPPAKPGLFSRVLDFVESRYGPSAAQYNGIAPRIGSITPGGGFSLGARYRNTLLFDRRAELRLDAMGSVKRYYMLGADFQARHVGRTPVFVGAAVQTSEYPEEDYFGLGGDSDEDDRTTYLYRSFSTAARAGIEMWDRVTLGGSFTFLNPGVGSGRDAAYPSIGEEFTEGQAPGLTAQPDFLVSQVFFDLNRVGDQEHRRIGRRLLVTLADFSDRDTGAFSFRRLDIDVRQYIPVLQAKRTFVLRGWFSASDASAGAQVPFYLQPYLGGRTTLRGYDDERFRGPNLLLLQGEYRFEVWPALDIALFYDTGMVAMRPRDITWSGLNDDYGISFRFGGENAVFRVDLAFGGETRRYSFAFGDVF